MNVFSEVLVFSMLSLGRILISNLVVANLRMYFPGMILLYLAAPFLHRRCFCMSYHLLLNTCRYGPTKQA